MKKALFFALISVLLTSCVSTSFYQVYKASPTDKSKFKENLLVYEDDNCKVSYNLWSDGGNIGFQFLNKTDKNIYLNLDESFFILNGQSYKYYKNRVFTNSTNSGISQTTGISQSKSVTGFNYLDLIQTNSISATNTSNKMLSKGYSVSISEEKIVCIPSKTSKIISEYSINNSLFRSCDLYKYPTKKQINTKTFSKEDSPIKFSNRIAYTIGQSDNLIKFENEFYIAEITNYPENEMYERKFDEYCDQRSTATIKILKKFSADKFYIKYNKGQDLWRH